MFSSSILTSLTRLFTFSTIVSSSSILPSENSKIITDSLTIVAKEASVNQKEDILLYSPINKLLRKLLSNITIFERINHGKHYSTNFAESSKNKESSEDIDSFNL